MGTVKTRARGRRLEPRAERPALHRIRGWSRTDPERADVLGLSAPTTETPHRLPPALSIDHIAVPAFWEVTSVERVSAIVEGAALSDHDSYVVEID